MSRGSFVRLFPRAAPWGGSLLFIRVAARSMAPPLSMCARVVVVVVVVVVGVAVSLGTLVANAPGHALPRLVERTKVIA